MNFFKKENGFALMDIIIALIVILLLMSLISIIFFNITKSSKEIERESQATYIATNIIEEFKKKNYDDVLLVNNQINIKDYTTNGNLIISSVEIPDGYNAYVKVVNYKPEGETSDLNLVKKITVTVRYKVGANQKEVELETYIVRN